MAAVWSHTRAELRRRWQATVLLAILVGLAGGVVLAAVAGARRTDSAMDRFLAYTRPMNVEVDAQGLDLHAVERLPQVADTDEGAYLGLVPSTPSGAPDPGSLGSVSPLVGARGRMGVTSERFLLVAGRRARPDRPLEVVANETVAARWKLRPGGTLRMWAYTPEQVNRPVLEGTAPVAPKGLAFDFTVTGVIRLPQDVSPTAVDQDVIYLGTGTVYLTPAFWRAYGTRVGNLGVGQEFRLGGGQRNLDAFRAAVRSLPGGRKATIQVGSDAELAAARANRAIHVQAVALLAFAILTAVAGLLVVGQGIARQVQLEAADRPTLTALGMTPSQLAVLALVRPALIGAGGAILAVVLAVLASPLAPIGLASKAEIDPGLSVDAPVLALGALGVLATVLARAVLAAWWLSRTTDGARGPGDQRPSRTAERLARTGAPPSAVTGVRLALEPGRAASAVPVRTALVGTIVAIGAVAASLTFAASLDRLVGSPALQGWNWDVVVGNYHNDQDITRQGARLARNPLVSGYSALAEAAEQPTIGGLDIPTIGVQPVKGAVLPIISRGREARSADEVAFGRASLRRLGLAVGDLVEVRGAGDPRKLRIVGEVLVPGFFNDTAVSGGAVVTMDGLRALFPGAAPNQFLVQYTPGADQAAAFASLRRDFGRTVLRALRPDEVENLRRVRGLPFALAALLALLGAATLGHLLATSVRRRRRDLAVLKTLGFVRGQVSATVAWQATTLAAVALLAGLPLGVAAGRWAWVLVNQGLGSPAGPVTPGMPLLAAVPAAVLVANLIAALPARAAAATRPAVVLRSE